jgi:hypothetical protein
MEPELATPPTSVGPDTARVSSRERQAGKQRVDATPAKEHQAAVDDLFDHTMTEEDAAHFRREKEAEFVPLKPEQTRVLPARKR